MNFWQKRDRGLHLLTALEIISANPENCDFEIRFSGHTFHAHRAVLMASSNYFRGMLQSNMKETVQGYIDIRGLEPTAVKKCLEYLYTGEIFLSDDTIETTLKSCDFLEIDEIRQICFEFMRKTVNAQNCLSFMEYATSYDSENTMDELVRFARSNYSDLIGTFEYRNCDKVIAIELLRTVKTYYSSDKLWDGICNWIEHKLEERRGGLLEFLGEIPNFNIKSTLDKVIVHSLIVKDRESFKYIVLNAFFKQWSEFSRFISTNNCFAVYGWVERFKCTKSEEFLGDILNFMEINFSDIYRHKNLSCLDDNDFFNLLDSERTRLHCETMRWQAVVKWLDNKNSKRVRFERMIPLVDLKKLSPDFIQTNVRCYPMVKISAVFTEKIMDALMHHSKCKTRPNACLLFDKTIGCFHCYYEDNCIRELISDKNLIGGTLLGGDAEAYVLNYPLLYQISSDGNIVVKQSGTTLLNEFETAVMHSKRIFVFHDVNEVSVFCTSECKWRTCLRDRTIPYGSCCCSTDRGIIFLGGGENGNSAFKYDPDSTGTVESKFGDLPSLPKGVTDASCTSINHSVFLVGGRAVKSDQFGFCRYDFVQVYSFRTQNWTIIQDSWTEFASRLTCCCRLGDALIVAGYKDSLSSYKDTPYHETLHIQNVSLSSSFFYIGIPHVGRLEITDWKYNPPYHGSKTGAVIRTRLPLNNVGLRALAFGGATIFSKMTFRQPTGFGFGQAAPPQVGQPLTRKARVLPQYRPEKPSPSPFAQPPTTKSGQPSPFFFGFKKI